MNKRLKVGPAKYMHGGYVQFSVHEDGSTAIVILSEDGEPEARATVKLPVSPPSRDFVWLRDWSENEGIPEALSAAGVVVLTDIRRECGMGCSALLARLTQRAIEIRDIENGER